MHVCVSISIAFWFFVLSIFVRFSTPQINNKSIKKSTQQPNNQNSKRCRKQKLSTVVATSALPCYDEKSVKIVPRSLPTKIAKSTPTALFFHWMNQTHNALINYNNQNASNDIPVETFIQGNFAAVSSAMGVSPLAYEWLYQRSYHWQGQL